MQPVLPLLITSISMRGVRLMQRVYSPLRYYYYYYHYTLHYYPYTPPCAGAITHQRSRASL